MNTSVGKRVSLTAGVALLRRGAHPVRPPHPARHPHRPQPERPLPGPGPLPQVLPYCTNCWTVATGAVPRPTCRSGGCGAGRATPPTPSSSPPSATARGCAPGAGLPSRTSTACWPGTACCPVLPCIACCTGWWPGSGCNTAPSRRGGRWDRSTTPFSSQTDRSLYSS